mmetsp:Transcript_1755/g.2883  ORF Transcript_1755/g.2883 Transcript_1755/m.2883 type:complete len:204 (-) Transcript_1755:240-851(-)
MFSSVSHCPGPRLSMSDLHNWSCLCLLMTVSIDSPLDMMCIYNPSNSGLSFLMETFTFFSFFFLLSSSSSFFRSSSSSSSSPFILVTSRVSSFLCKASISNFLASSSAVLRDSLLRAMLILRFKPEDASSNLGESGLLVLGVGSDGLLLSFEGGALGLVSFRKGVPKGSLSMEFIVSSSLLYASFFVRSRSRSSSVIRFGLLW